MKKEYKLNQLYGQAWHNAIGNVINTIYHIFGVEVAAPFDNDGEKVMMMTEQFGIRFDVNGEIIK